MKGKVVISKMWSMLLSIALVFAMIPMSAVPVLAADGIPDVVDVYVNDTINFQKGGRTYYTNGGSAAGTLENNPGWNAHYDPSTGVLELKNYSGKSIFVGGVAKANLTIKLTGNNTVTCAGSQFAVVNSVGGDFVITSDSGGKLTVNLSGGNNDVNGITAGYGSYATGNVTIKGSADVTVNATATSTGDTTGATGIYAKEKVSILDSASYKAVCKSKTQSGGGGSQGGSGIYAGGELFSTPQEKLILTPLSAV